MIRYCMTLEEAAILKAIQQGKYDQLAVWLESGTLNVDENVLS